MEFHEVGGCVRDELLGVPSKDIDFAVEARSFAEMERFLVGEGFTVFLRTPEFLTIRARFPRNRAIFGREDMESTTADFVLCRKDGAYSDGRRPDEVIPGTIFDDLARRDFTINAMARNLRTGEILDPFNGQQHLNDRLLVAVGSAEERFREDALRSLRAIRFMVTKGFRANIDIIEALKSEWLPPLLASVSRERVRDEMRKAFAKDTVRTLDLLWSLTPEFVEAVFTDGLWLEPSQAKP